MADAAVSASYTARHKAKSVDENTVVRTYIINETTPHATYLIIDEISGADKLIDVHVNNYDASDAASVMTIGIFKKSNWDGGTVISLDAGVDADVDLVMSVTGTLGSAGRIDMSDKRGEMLGRTASDILTGVSRTDACLVVVDFATQNYNAGEMAITITWELGSK